MPESRYQGSGRPPGPTYRLRSAKPSSRRSPIDW
jgi:hypothetical protein